MATELSFLPPNQSHQNHTHQPPYPSIFTRSGGTWMWTSHPAHDDDSWEVRAFAEDTASLLGTTWPPRSYTCNFCRREFRSAQALGGHMNVHRRDRARLHQAPPPPASSASSALFFRSQEFAGNGGLCLLYQLPNPSNPNGVFTPATINPWNNNSIDSSPSTLLSVSPYPAASTSIGASPSNYPVIPPGFGPSKFYYRKPESPSFPDEDNRRKEGGGQELDLELRLGQGPATTPLP